MAAGGQSACAANPVDVGLHACREIIIDYVGKALDVQAPASNISSHQYLGCAILEGLQGGLQG